MKKMTRISCLVLAGLMLVGCQGPIGQKLPAPTNPPIAQATPATPDTTNPEEAAKYRAELAAGEKAYTAAKSKFASDPKSAAEYVRATVDYGTTTMNSPLLSPKEKYPKALKLYAEALRQDPKNEEAINNTKLIEGIYAQMGRPVPK